ncbi:hypothetical protein BG006_001170 [Podila minutissima]|uniref:Uncharacterized protein n=1 Tax=Podila minutissima TaxID=64525 RepID=A0A9P5SE44_9FUNG|nr:hypothetical protein BG006_001170 [Podila minutissima]
MVPVIQMEEALSGKKHFLHARGINQFSRSPILIHKRHGAAWRAKQAHRRKVKHSKHSKAHHKTSKHNKHSTHKLNKHQNKSSHRNKESSQLGKKKASLGHTSSESKEKSSDRKTEKKILSGSSHSTQRNKGKDKNKEKEQNQTAPKLESKAKVPVSHVEPKVVPAIKPKVAPAVEPKVAPAIKPKVVPAHAPSDSSLAGVGGFNTPPQGVYSSWGSSIPFFNNLPAQETPAPHPGRFRASKIIALSLIPLAAVVAVAYGVGAYRRRIARRHHRRQVLLDAEAAAAAAGTSGGNDDEGSLMSAVSYRPPAPFTSEVDVSIEVCADSDPEIVIGDNSLHQVPAPQRDASHADNYQDYSHVCHSQILGKTCTNHSIRCFVALNHSNAGLDIPESKTPAAYRSDREMPSAHVTLDSVTSKE